MKLKSVHIVLIAIFCSAMLLVTLWALYVEHDRPWKEYQKEFYKLTCRTTKNPKCRQKAEKIQQIWLPELGIVDRCITCHQAEDRKGFHNAPHPFKIHSGNYLKIHPVKRFGCVVCHDGQGEALTVDDAHGKVTYSGRSLLKGKFTEASCMRCHQMPQSMPLDTVFKDALTLSRGWQLFNKYNCVACHKLTGYKRPEHIAPSLSKIGSKVKREWLFRWLKKPEDYFPDTRMPLYRFTDQDMADIASYLFELKDKDFQIPLGFIPDDKKLIQKGKILFESIGCLGCHKINDKGVSFGPDLSDIGNKVRPEWLYQFLKNPKSYDPKTIIPDFRLNKEDIPAITAYLISLKKEEPQRKEVVNTSLSGDKERGKKLINDYGCLGCHEIEKLQFQYIAPPLDGIGDKRVEELAFGNVRDIERSLEAWLRLKVTEPGKFTTEKMIMRMPKFNLNKEQAEAMVVYLSGIRKEDINDGYKKDIFDPDDILLNGKKIFEKYNCLGCHKIKDKGGEIGPELTNEGKKSRPEWLFRFFKGPWKIRPEPILRARMPDFNFSDREAEIIIEYLSYLSEEPYPYILEERRKVYPEDIYDGEKLYREVFACIACHRINGRGGEIGPDHTDLASRLKREWIEKWVKDPTSINPDVRMPRFKFEDWQFKAIVNYLMTLGRYRFVEEANE